MSASARLVVVQGHAAPTRARSTTIAVYLKRSDDGFDSRRGSAALLTNSLSTLPTKRALFKRTLMNSRHCTCNLAHYACTCKGDGLTGLNADMMTFIEFQTVAGRWMQETFGDLLSVTKKSVRNFRFFEEATELIQAGGMTREQAHELVDYVFNRPVGDLQQEVGGTMLTLTALCATNGVELAYAAYAEIERTHQPEVREKIRRKQASKMGDGPLPGTAT